MNPKRLYPTKAEICEEVRRFQTATRVEMTDDEVKGILCRAMSDEPPDPHWEARVVAFCVEALRERSTSAKKDDET